MLDNLGHIGFIDHDSNLDGCFIRCCWAGLNNDQLLNKGVLDRNGWHSLPSSTLNGLLGGDGRWAHKHNTCNLSWVPVPLFGTHKK